MTRCDGDKKASGGGLPPLNHYTNVSTLNNTIASLSDLLSLYTERFVCHYVIFV